MYPKHECTLTLYQVWKGGEEGDTTTDTQESETYQSKCETDTHESKAYQSKHETNTHENETST